MAMPEAPMNKNYAPVLRQNYVWAPWQVFPVEAEAEPKAVKRAADSFFGHRVLSADLRHY
jgi:hypothetical protein